VDDGVNLDDGRFNSVSDKCRRCGAHTETTEI
jgi:hypothetical protein